jgi:hypothetical protein
MDERQCTCAANAVDERQRPGSPNALGQVV